MKSRTDVLLRLGATRPFSLQTPALGSDESPLLGRRVSCLQPSQGLFQDTLVFLWPGSALALRSA
ncbi:MAG TPA: hypothetical protein VJ123_07140, partial [Anaerolineales bacterium]|nr:hypothetical protein [Anaerolineales bacterium]